MKKVFVLLLSTISLQTFACTTFGVFKETEKILGKSFQWPNSSGYIVVNKRNLQKTSLQLKPSDRPITWTSRYGSVTSNQHGVEFPLGGVNEAGLVVEVMWGGFKDPTPNALPSLNELQWIQFQLDNFSTVDEVVENLARYRWSRVFGFVHYLACDALGRCAAIEPLYDENPLVHSKQEMFVNTLANDTYEDSVNFLKLHIGFGGSLSIPSGGDSLSRFVRASHFANKAAEDTAPLGLHTAFEILNKVATGAWDVAYDFVNQTMAFRTVNEPKLKRLDTARWDFSCTTPRQLFPMNDATAEGDVTEDFEPYSLALNEKIVTAGASGLSGISTAVIKAFQNYP